MIPLETGGLVTALQGLDVKPDMIEKVVATLTTSGSELEGALDNAVIDSQEFGNRASAQLLATHYAKAHEVMQATIDGIAADLVAFGQTARAAAAYVDEADTASAADLDQARRSIDDLATLADHTENRQRYDDARNGQVPTNGGD